MAKKRRKENFFGEAFEPSKLEERILEFWEKNGIFEKSLKKTKSKKPFTFYDGPPFATGLPHYGHILASTIKDVVPRYQTMRGRLVRRRWGWDCHGLPIEEIIERKLGISGKKQIEAVGIKKFNENCRNAVLKYAEEWGKMIRRMARWVEFENSYKTMDADYMESVWWAFKEIYKKGLVYEGRKVLLYCPRCETPVSNFEVAMDNSYRDVTEESVTVKFHLKPGQKFGKGGKYITKDKAYILSWTTTPWTLPGNVALAVGADINYVALRLQDAPGLYVLASDRVKAVLGGRSIEVVHAGIKGRDLIGLEYEPLFSVPAVKSKKSFRVYPADFVTTDEGTGVVHTAVVYGEEDYELGLRESLPVVPLLDDKGIFNKQAPKSVRGKYFKDSEKIIKDDLAKRGLLFKREGHAHSYPYCWRCGRMLFYNAIPAWFINVQKIKPKILGSNNREINWFPAHLKHGRYEKSVEAAPDWNISRNRYWGNPMPVWKCGGCGCKEAVGSLDELSLRAGGARNRYWVMRHGESQNLAKRIIDSGQKAYPLTLKGYVQAENSAKKLKQELARQKGKMNLVFSSDVMRVKETAKIAANILGVKRVIVDKRLHEINLAGLSGRRDSDYHKAFPTYESRFEKRPEGGESLRDLRRRVWGFLADTEKKYKNKNILLVSHEYPIWMFTHAAEAWSEKKAIKEKEKIGDDFINVGEVRPLELKVIPRSETGEVDLHRPYIDEVALTCSSCGKKMKRTPEIFDSWLEAGSMPFAEHHYPFENKDIFENRFPAQFVAEYIAQTRAWFYVMHVVSVVLFGRAPFENVVTTGTILAEDGSKMSKSRGNFPDPKLAIDKYGADSLRFYLMNSVVMEADNLNFSEKGVESAYRKVGLLLYNVYNYFKTYLPQRNSSVGSTRGGAKQNVLDAWVKIRTGELISTVTGFLDKYDTVHATRAIQEYVSDLSTWYLRRSRRRKDPDFFNTLRGSLLETSKVMAPFMPFLAEALYLSLGGGAESVHLEDWPKIRGQRLEVRGQKKLLGEMAEVRRLASLALAKRAESGIKVRQPLTLLKVNSKSKLSHELLDVLADEVNVRRAILDSKLKNEVELDTAITPALKEEGTLRELIRMVQELRQEAGLEPKDKVVLMAELPEIVHGIVSRNEKLLKAEVGAKSIEYKKSAKFNAEIATKIEGADVWLAVQKI